MLISESYWHGSSDVTSVSKLWAKIISLNLCWSHTNAVSITGLNSAHFQPEKCTFECLLEASVSPEALNRRCHIQILPQQIWCQTLRKHLSWNAMHRLNGSSSCVKVLCVASSSLSAVCLFSRVSTDNPGSVYLWLTLGSSDSHCIHRSEHTAGALCDVRKTCVTH